MAEPILVGKVLRKRFQLSSLSSEEKKRLGSKIKHLGGTYLDKQIFMKQVTHVVCGQPNRGEKYLGGCVSGRWIMKKEFIEDSFRQGRWLCEEDYEWGSDALAPHSPDHPLIALYDAPKKWRTTLKNNEGAFQTWKAIVLVKDSKMKNAYERLLEAGSATVLKKNSPFVDRNLNEEVTHVFVEANLMSEVMCFKSDGIPCITPDYIAEYIIQVAKEHALRHLTVKDTYNYSALKSIKPSLKSKRTTRAVLPGKENGPNGTILVQVETTTSQAAGKGMKRHAPDCELCAVKRQKIQNGLFPHHGGYVARNKVEKTRSWCLAFPTYASSIVESCVDEGYISLALDAISSSLSNRHVPSPQCLQMVMNQFLLNSALKNQAVKSYHLLNQIISLHSPASCQSLYLKALQEPVVKQSTDDDFLSPWQFVSKVVRCSLEVVSSTGETTRIQENADLLLQFFDTLFKQDANTTASNQTPMLLQIIWPRQTAANKTKDTIKEFVNLCYKSATLAIHDNSKLIVCRVLLDMLSLAVTLKKRDDISGQQDCDLVAQQLFLVLSKTGSSEATKLLLEKCYSSWLKMRIAELILGNFDKRLIPQVHRPLVDKKLSLKKIVSCYFFLLPKTVVCKKSKKTMNKKHNAEKNNVILRNNLDDDFDETEKIPKRNAKGETSLHVACILNDVKKVEDILKRNIDVNATDNAGWTALHEACNYGHFECVKKIIEYHERTNHVNLLASPPDGTTVLHDAVGNNHLSVVKLLTQVGGRKLMEAKTSTGKTALDLAGNPQMAEFLKSETNRITQNEQLLDQLTSVQPLSEDYGMVLGERRSKTTVAMKDCQEYLFLVSQFLQGYVKENIETFSNFTNEKKPCKHCTHDFQCWQQLQQHVDNIEIHAMRITRSTEQLSAMCQLYITTMRLCINV